MKTQIIVIHGGETFDSYDKYLDFLNTIEIDLDYLKKVSWKGSLPSELGDDFDVVAPKMPNSLNAQYSEWKIWFEKVLEKLDKKIICLGHSLGGIFLVKYLAENKIDKNIIATLLVAAPFDDCESEYSLGDFVLPENLGLLEEQGGKIIFYHSEDDPVVSFLDLNKYKKIVPDAEYRIFEDRQHFNQETFSEIVEDIKSICR
jgi:predicted alpha/beta hydrolase family esterase